MGWRSYDGAVQPEEIAALLARARAGDSAAWDDLYRAIAGWVRAVAGALGIRHDDISDINQVVCLRLVDHIDRLRVPEALRGWVVTVTRHEGYRLLRERRRVTTADPAVEAEDRTLPPMDDALLRSERQRELRDAFRRLPGRCQRLLRLVAADPPLSYADIASSLDRPVGSIGPSRQRCLERLRQLLADDPGVVTATGQPNALRERNRGEGR
jgi:RNA polymerase sigma factor (sigma-70 family)